MQLTHYTPEVHTVGKILVNGFAYVPNKRGLIVEFLSSHDFSEREPQAFGMVSFTELPPDRAQGPRETFGNYGIVVSGEWASSHHMQKVLYVAREGPIFEALCWLFQHAYVDLKERIKFPEDAAWQMAYTNKVMAGIAGGLLYANLLQLYEYLEPIEHSYQQEWRVVHPYPVYGYGKTKQEIIGNVSPPKGWAKHLHTLSVQPSDVLGFVCPVDEEEILRGCVPSEYRDKPVHTFEV